MTRRTVADDVFDIATDLARSTSDAALRARAESVAARLTGPLRVAIAGKVKAGKSTLLNALVGERLAPTDAGECTRIVTTYQRGDGYDVVARMRDGRTEPLRFDRSNGSLDIRLGAHDEADIDTIDVSWPTSSLASITLIDTPGLASIDDDNSRRTRDFLEAESEHPGDADAVIYLIRHAHRADMAFLEAFMDRSVTAASPVNAVAVLSRADEIGAGRLDAMQSSARIARRYQDDPQLRALCAAVVPLAGLLAETGLTLRDHEVANLRLLAATDDDTLRLMMMSADDFCEISNSELTVESRRDLLDRLGMFGVRLAVQEIRSGRGASVATLGPTMVRHSGLTELRALLEQHFGPRARVLQARSGIVALRSITRSLRDTDPALAARIEAELERVEVSTVEFAQARAVHLIASGSVALSPDDQAQLARAFAATDASGAMDLPPHASRADIQAQALTRIEHWRTLGADPLADPLLVEVCDTAARTFEQLYVSTSTGSAAAFLPN